MSSFQEQHPELVLEILQAGERVCESHVPCETTFHNIRSEMLCKGYGYVTLTNIEAVITEHPAVIARLVRLAREHILQKTRGNEPSADELRAHIGGGDVHTLRDICDRIIREELGISEDTWECIKWDDGGFPYEVIIDVEKACHNVLSTEFSISSVISEVKKLRVRAVDSGRLYKSFTARDVMYALKILGLLLGLPRSAHEGDRDVLRVNSEQDSPPTGRQTGTFLDTLPEPETTDDLRISVKCVRADTSEFATKKYAKNTAYFVSPLPSYLRDKHAARASILHKNMVPDGVLQFHSDWDKLFSRKSPAASKDVDFRVFIAELVLLPLLAGAILPWALTVLNAVVCYLLIAIIAGGAPIATYKLTNVRRSKELALSKSEVSELKGSLRPISNDNRDILALSLAASTIAHSIDASPAWQSRYCDMDRIRLNLIEETTQIADTCQRLTDLRNLIQSVKLDGDSDVTKALREEASARNATFLSAYLAVERRVAALHAYRLGLKSIETLLDDMDKVQRMMDTDAAMRGILNDMAMNEIATPHIQSMTRDLDSMRENLETQLEFIRSGVVNNPSLDAPLRLAEISA